MTRFSLGREEDEEGPSSRRPVTKKPRTLNGTFSCNTVNEQQRRCEIEETVSEEEWESESEEIFPLINGDSRVNGSEEESGCDLEGLRGNGSVSVTLSDPDVLDCPICLESLSVPVFQCENGHIACASCCIKIANKCPSCCWPIGYNRCRAIEKVLESVKVSCINQSYGCKEILSYSKKTDHENVCIYVPCSCPFRGCDFVGTSTKVYAHFSEKHGSSAEHVFFNAVHPIYVVEKNQRYQILQMRTEGIIFIINHASDRLGSAVNIICVGPASQKRRFIYELVATDGESSFKLESVAENIPSWSENCALKKFLFIPRDVNSSARLKLDVCIEEREYIFSGSTTT